MRYEPSQRLLRLALMLAGSRVGLTLDEIARDLGVGRRTAERLRDSLAAMFPQLETWDDEARSRRWRLPVGALVGLAEPRTEAVAAVEAVARDCAERGEPDRAGSLREAAAALRALMRPASLRRAEPDIAALMEAEGTAMRPGPRARLDPALLPALRRAILGMRLVSIRYAARDVEVPMARIVCPYGTLYGGNGGMWLVGPVEGLAEMRLWRLDRIISFEVLERGFDRREDFDLRAYAARSFGVFQEEPVEVVLRISPDAAEDAARWLFHPSQTATREQDGAWRVAFCAGGVQEICWHLFTWGNAVTILSPAWLRPEMAQMAASVAAHHAHTLD